MPTTTGHTLKTSLKVLGQGAVPAYTLEHLTTSQAHARGQVQTIVVDYIELGRDRACAVRFADDQTTVSRRHAALERQGNQVTLLHLSATNQTFVNGQPVTGRQPLQNGQVIQLSPTGPQLRFNISANGTAALGFTHRFKLVAQQAVRPYRALVISLLVLLVAAVGGGGFALYRLFDQTLAQTREIEQLKAQGQRYLTEISQQLEAERERSRQLASSLAGTTLANGELLSRLRVVENRPLPRPVVMAPPAPADGEVARAAYEQFKNQVMYLRVSGFQLLMPNGELEQVDMNWEGTGFLLADGRLVTARHCIQAWRYLSTGANGKTEQAVNILEQSGAEPIITFDVFSPEGKKGTFTYKDVRLDDSGDQVYQVPTDGPDTVNIKIALPDASDWAYVRFPGASSLPPDPDLARRLAVGSPVVVLGYSYGIDLQGDQLKPVLSQSRVAIEGLTNGVITLSDRNFESGNSGGPVLAANAQGQYQAVGIVSSGRGSVGFVVPISALK
ncbi:MAG: FHA domain-containing protein [Bernardetiaceae bacterium]|jgi:pSer/pThr/pTyr-binding forkhead associated (FHA) protein|nr:FHA domain-containing protein [Bernardetiaceae bacterium]